MKIQFKNHNDENIEGKSTEFDKSLSQAHKVNSRIFGTRFDRFLFIVCYSEKEFMTKSKSVSNAFTAIAYKDKKIFIKSMDMIIAEGRWKKNYVPKLIAHEINHMYWYHLKKTWSPYWLCEGLASFAGDNFRVPKKDLQKLITKYKVSSSMLEFRYLSKHFKNGHEPRYQVWADFTRYIVKMYGLKKIVKVCMQNTKADYLKTFKNLFGRSDKDIFNKYLEEIKGKK